MTPERRPESDDSRERPLSPDETVALLRRIRSGEDAALEALLVRVLPRLRRWAHGRLPRASRGLLETADIVQVVASKAAKQFSRLEFEQSFAFGCYLRSALKNALHDEWDRVKRSPMRTTLPESQPVDQTSPLERLIGAERMARYEAALARLDETDRSAIIGRFELAYSYDDLAHFLGKPSAGAARVAVSRAVKRLIEQARHV